MVNPLHPRLRRWLLALGFCLASIAPSSCALYTQDRCFAEDHEYTAAREIFAETGSMDLVRRRMGEMGWRRCLQNEIVYRLTKEFEASSE